MKQKLKLVKGTEPSQYFTEDRQYTIWKDDNEWWHWEHATRPDVTDYRTRNNAIADVLEHIEQVKEENQLWEQ